MLREIFARARTYASIVTVYKYIVTNGIAKSNFVNLCDGVEVYVEIYVYISSNVEKNGGITRRLKIKETADSVVTLLVRIHRLRLEIVGFLIVF